MSKTQEARETISSHISRTIARRFVGRDAILERLSVLASEAQSEPRIASLIGPPGVGKTALSTVFRLRCDADAVVRWVWCEHILNEPALRKAVGDIEALGHERSAVLVLDGFEALGELGERFLHRMLPKAGPRFFLLISSRTRVGPRVRAMLGPLHEEFAINVLDDDASRSLLSNLGVPEEQHDAIVAEAGGLPLALVLSAEQGLQTNEETPFLGPDVVADLVQRFVQEAPSERHQRALYACSMLPVSAANLSAIIDVEDASAEYDWLAKRSFLRVTSEGLSPHDWVRTALYADLVRRRPKWLDAMSVRAARRSIEQMGDVDMDGRRRLYIRAMQTRRDLPLIGEQMAIADVARTSVRRIEAGEYELVSQAVERHEGQEGLRCFLHLLQTSPEEVFVTCNTADRPIGLVSDMTLTPALRPYADPVSARALDLLDENPQWAAGGVKMFRWLMSIDDYMSPSLGLSSVTVSGPVVTSLARKLPRRLLFAMADPDKWDALAPMFLLERLPAEVTFHGRDYGFFVIDFAKYAAEWTEPNQMLEVVLSRTLEHLIGARPSRARLDRAMFDSALRHALSVLHRETELAESVLLTSTLIDADRAKTDAFRTLIFATVRELSEVPGYQESMEALDRTYLRPAVKQRAAAAELGVPFGTYRHRLRKGISLLVETLWAKQE